MTSHEFRAVGAETAATPVLTGTADQIAVITLNRPKVKNALNTELIEQLRAALVAARDDDDVRVIILTGTGGAFCAGADISQFEKLAAEHPVEVVSGSTTELWSVMRNIRKPIIAAVDGLALGGGLEIALACDFIVASEGAKLGLPEVRLGAVPGAGGTQRIISALGKAKGMRLLLSAEPITAAAAFDGGLVSDLAPPGEALSVARTIAQKIAANGPLAVALVKDAALASLDLPMEAGLAFERRNFSIALQSADLKEGQQAFFEKRVPNCTGR